MLKTLSRLELLISDKIYHFTCDPDCPIEHVKEALFQFQKYVGMIEDASKAAKPDASNSEVKPDIEPIAEQESLGG